MELSNLPPRMELAINPSARETRVPPRATSTAPETLRPVVAAETPHLPAPIKGLGIAPLDLFQVGDNDETPPPPEPPRRSVMLSVQPAPVPQTEEASTPPAKPAASPPMAEQSTAAPATTVASHQPSHLPHLVEALELGPEQHTMDVRR